LMDAKTTDSTFSVMVRPNTNIVLIDYFNYDESGALDTVASGFWNHLTGVLGQMQVGNALPGFVTVDQLDNTENLQAKLLGAPFLKSSGGALYASYIVDMDDPSIPNGSMPIANGSYFTVFNDGSGVTGPYECRLIAATNGAALGYYRLGINNFGATAADAEAKMFQQDLTPGQFYVVVTKLDLATGQSTLWLNPDSQSSASVTDTATADQEGATLYDISDFELRESGSDAGSVLVGNLKIGTTFDSVFPSPQVSTNGTGGVVVTWSDPTLNIQSATSVAGPWSDVTGVTSPYTNGAPPSTIFYKFGQ